MKYILFILAIIFLFSCRTGKDINSGIYICCPVDPCSMGWGDGSIPIGPGVYNKDVPKKFLLTDRDSIVNGYISMLCRKDADSVEECSIVVYLDSNKNYIRPCGPVKILE